MCFVLGSKVDALDIKFVYSQLFKALNHTPYNYINSPPLPNNPLC